MLTPRQSPPVMRTLAGDYVVRDGRVVFVRWGCLTAAERASLYQRVRGAAGPAAPRGC